MRRRQRWHGTSRRQRQVKKMAPNLPAAIYAAQTRRFARIPGALRRPRCWRLIFAAQPYPDAAPVDTDPRTPTRRSVCASAAPRTRATMPAGRRLSLQNMPPSTATPTGAPATDAAEKEKCFRHLRTSQEAHTTRRQTPMLPPEHMPESRGECSERASCHCLFACLLHTASYCTTTDSYICHTLAIHIFFETE